MEPSRSKGSALSASPAETTENIPEMVLPNNPDLDTVSEKPARGAGKSVVSDPGTHNTSITDSSDICTTKMSPLHIITPKETTDDQKVLAGPSFTQELQHRFQV